MSSTGEHAQQRVGDAERQAAIVALGEHWRAGRLDPAEHERRTTAAFSAVTRGDLDALFVDLAGGGAQPVTQDSGTPVLSGEAVNPSVPAEPPAGGGGLVPVDSWVGQHRDAIMGLMPFVALVLFFVTKSWLFFLLIPASGIVLYAGDDDPNGRKARRRARDERRRLDRGE